MINKIATNLRLGTPALEKLTAKKFNDLMAYQKPITLTDESIIKWNLRKGYNAQVTIGANRTLSLEQLTPGDYGTIKVIQGGAGSFTLTLPTNPVSKVADGGAGAVTLSTAAGSVDILVFYYDGTNLNWNISKNYT